MTGTSFIKGTALTGLTALLTPWAYAETVSMDLSSHQLMDISGSTGLWNVSEERIQPPYLAGGDRIDFGDGRDGEFSDGPAQTGISVSGDTITINTSVKNVFRFTRFQLSAGKTLNVIGSKPLVVRVLGTVTVDGVLNASGADGQANHVGHAPGSGRAGGSSGGPGGAVDAVNATFAGTGGAPSAFAAGGSGGQNWTTGFDGNGIGGGGGCLGSGAGFVAIDGFDGGGVGGGSGAGDCSANSWSDVADAFGDLFENNVCGGAGGGGGSANFSVDSVVGGGGGGGGGGAIQISAAGSVSVSGVIQANGGDGGDNEADNGNGACGGAGGGGSGGAVWIQTPLSLTGSGAGVMDVSPGAGGTRSVVCSNGNADSGRGGDGSRGVIRLDGTDAGNVSFDPEGTADRVNAVTMGDGTATTYKIVSKPIDLSQGYFTLSGVKKTVSCSSTDAEKDRLKVYFAGSNDGESFDRRVSEDRVDELANYPYVRFEVEIGTDGTDPACLTSLSFEKNPSELTDLKVSGGLICGFAPRAGGGPLALAGDLLVLLISGLSALRVGRRGIA